MKCNDFFCQLEYSNICSCWSDCRVLCRSYECVEEVIQRQEPLISVLRLLILLSITNNGLPKKHFDYFRWIFWNIAETSLLIVSNQDCHLLKFHGARFPWYKNHSTHIHSCFLWSLSLLLLSFPSLLELDVSFRTDCSSQLSFLDPNIPWLPDMGFKPRYIS